MENHLSSFLADYQVVLDSSVSLPPEIRERYAIVDCLHEAATSSTFLVKDIADGSLCVLKIAEKHTGHNLFAEHQILSALNAPAFPKALLFRSDDTSEYFLRSYISGTPISDYVEHYGPLSERETIRVGIGFCDTLSELHRQNPPVIHRDIKPQNLIYTPEHGLALIDFDAARHYQPKRRSDTVCLGTQTTAAPEQFGYKQTDQRSDIYSTGVLLLYFCTGSYDLGGCASIQNKKLARVIETCTQFDPERRYVNIRQLQLDLRYAARAQTLPAKQFLRGTCVGLALGFGVALLLSAVGLMPGSRNERQALAANVALAKPSPAVTNPIIMFDSPEIEQAVRAQLGVDATAPLTQDDLDRVTTLYLFGEETLTNWNDTTFYSIYRTNTTSGTIRTLSDIPKLRNLTDLAVCNQGITDVSPLSGTQIVRLALGGNQISDLSPLSELPYLNELYVGKNPIVQINALSICSFLRVLDISGTSVMDLSPIASLELHSLFLKDTTCDDYSLLTGMPMLERLSVSNINERQLETISRLTSLTSLDYQGTAPDLAPLLKLTKLTRLTVFDSQFTSLEGIEALSQLTYLLVFCAPNIDLAPLARLPKLTTLDIVSQQMTDYSAIFLLKNLSELFCKAEQKDAIDATGKPIHFKISVL